MRSPARLNAKSFLAGCRSRVAARHFLIIAINKTSKWHIQDFRDLGELTGANWVDPPLISLYFPDRHANGIAELSTRYASCGTIMLDFLSDGTSIGTSCS